MHEINIQVDGGTEGETNALVIEGNVESLRDFSARLGAVVNNEIESVSEVMFDDSRLTFMYNGRVVRFKVSKVNEIIRRSWWKNRDMWIAFGVVAACLMIVLVALIKSGHNSPG